MRAVALAGALLAGLSAAPSMAGPVAGSFTGSDGFSVQIPEGWHVSDSGARQRWEQEGSFSIQNVEPGCTPSCHIDDGQAKLAFERSRGSAQDPASLKQELCAQAPRPTLDCRLTAFGGRTWAWALWEDDGVEIRRIATEVGPHRYAATALIGLGEQRDAMRSLTKGIMLTIRIQPGPLATTGPGIESPWLALLGVVILGAGCVLQRAAAVPRRRR